MQNDLKKKPHLKVIFLSASKQALKKATRKKKLKYFEQTYRQQRYRYIA